MIYVPSEQYFDLKQQIKTLRQECQASYFYNHNLKEVILRQQEKIICLENTLRLQQNSQKQNHQNLVKHVNQTSSEIKTGLKENTNHQQTFIQEQVEKIKKSFNVKKLKELEKKITDDRLRNFQMVNFFQKIKNIYQVYNQKMDSPTPSELYKWINDSVLTMNKEKCMNLTKVQKEKNQSVGKKKWKNYCKVDDISMRQSHQNKSLNRSLLNEYKEKTMIFKKSKGVSTLF